MAARYVTTDLCLRAHFDLGPLARHLEASGLVLLGTRVRDGEWSGTLEAGGTSGDLDREVESLLRAVEGLDGDARLDWDRCLAREFDLGFRCEGDDFCATAAVGPDLVRRIAARGGAVRITIYRDAESQASEPPSPS